VTELFSARKTKKMPIIQARFINPTTSKTVISASSNRGKGAMVDAGAERASRATVEIMSDDEGERALALAEAICFQPVNW